MMNNKEGHAGDLGQNLPLSEGKPQENVSAINQDRVFPLDNHTIPKIELFSVKARRDNQEVASEIIASHIEPAINTQQNIVFLLPVDEDTAEKINQVALNQRTASIQVLLQSFIKKNLSNADNSILEAFAIISEQVIVKPEFKDKVHFIGISTATLKSMHDDLGLLATYVAQGWVVKALERTIKKNNSEELNKELNILTLPKEKACILKKETITYFYKSTTNHEGEATWKGEKEQGSREKIKKYSRLSDSEKQQTQSQNEYLQSIISVISFQPEEQWPSFLQQKVKQLSPYIPQSIKADYIPPLVKSKKIILFDGISQYYKQGTQQFDRSKQQQQIDDIFDQQIWQPLQADPNKKIALLYAANKRQATALIKNYSTGQVFDVFSGSGQAILFAGLAKKVTLHKLQNRVHFIGISTSCYGGENNPSFREARNNVVSLEQINQDLKVVASHVAADWEVKGLMRPQHPNQLAIGGGASKHWTSKAYARITYQENQVFQYRQKSIVGPKVWELETLEKDFQDIDFKKVPKENDKNVFSQDNYVQEMISIMAETPQEQWPENLQKAAEHEPPQIQDDQINDLPAGAQSQTLDEKLEAEKKRMLSRNNRPPEIYNLPNNPAKVSPLLPISAKGKHFPIKPKPNKSPWSKVILGMAVVIAVLALGGIIASYLSNDFNQMFVNVANKLFHVDVPLNQFRVIAISAFAGIAGIAIIVGCIASFTMCFKKKFLNSVENKKALKPELIPILPLQVLEQEVSADPADQDPTSTATTYSPPAGLEGLHGAQRKMTDERISVVVPEAEIEEQRQDEERNDDDNDDIPIAALEASTCTTTNGHTEQNVC